LREIYIELYPDFADVASLSRPSPSASVRDPQTGKALKRGEHLYVLLDDPTQSKACLQAMMRLAWIKGIGRPRLDVAEDGRPLVHGPVDTSVGSPERLAYEGSVIVGNGIDRLPRKATVTGGTGVLRAAELLGHADQHAPRDAYYALVKTKLDDPAFIAKQKEKRAQWLAKKIEEAVSLGVPREEAEKDFKRTVRRRRAGGGARSDVSIDEREWRELSPHHVLHKPSGEAFLVSDIMKNPKAFHETECADPIEGLNYQTNNPGWIVIDGGRIEIFSRAHGDSYAYYTPLFTEEEVAAKLRKVFALYNIKPPIVAPNWRERFASGLPKPSLENARLAIQTLGIVCRYNDFTNQPVFAHDNNMIDISDLSVMALRQMLSATFSFDFTEKHVRDAAMTLALARRFNPVVDLLAEAEANWDGVARLDRLAADYLNVKDTRLNAAFGRKTMIAAVARARTPGCKFDTITVLEGPQGANKSSAWRVLAMRDEWFSDAKIIGKEGREVQEQLGAIWIHESADLAGMKKADVEIVKEFASRQVDNARPAYGHFLKRQPRHSIEVGTTNASTYLMSQDGNRRFWPMTVLKEINLDKLTRDRMQLWGEAAHYQSQGESLVLDRTLWAKAGVEQEARRVRDAWEDILADLPVRTDEKSLGVVHQINGQERVAAVDLLDRMLQVARGQQTTTTAMRLATVMRVLGWKRSKNGYVTIGGRRVTGYFRP
jgi:hypothetical protein